MVKPDRAVPDSCSGLFRNSGTACSKNAWEQPQQFGNSPENRHFWLFRGGCSEIQSGIISEQPGFPTVPLFPLRGDGLSGTARLPRGLAPLGGRAA